MRNSYDYIEGKLAEQRAAAEMRRRVAAARNHRSGSVRHGGFLRFRSGRSSSAGGCVE